MGLGSEVRKKYIPDPGSGSRGKKFTGSRIRIRKTGYYIYSHFRSFKKRLFMLENIITRKLYVFLLLLVTCCCMAFVSQDDLHTSDTTKASSALCLCSVILVLVGAFVSQGDYHTSNTKASALFVQ
jgi:hypothetical protein